MDTVLKKGVIAKKAKIAILGIIMVSVFLGTIFFIINYRFFLNAYIKIGPYFPSGYSNIGLFLEFPYVYIGLSFLGVAIYFLFVFFMTKKMNITITDKRVCGNTYFGRSVDLPIDSISAVGSSWFNGIAVSTSSGKVSFLYIENSKEIRELLCQLLIERQEKRKSDIPAKSNADELKKYKELLDSGIITQEEFEAKKKQLLGL